jgi:hypothetical protein
MVLGAITFIWGGLWLVGGAGIFGSPVAGVFDKPKTLFANTFKFWILWTVVVGPMTLLPCALLERFFPRVGAVAMIIAAIIVAESGIRCGCNDWGYCGVDALIVIGCITTPMLLLSVSLLALGAQRIRWKVAGVALFVLILCFDARYTVEKNYCNANCSYPTGKQYRYP